MNIPGTPLKTEERIGAPALIGQNKLLEMITISPYPW
jgi:hypothetical protein